MLTLLSYRTEDNLNNEKKYIQILEFIDFFLSMIKKGLCIQKKI